MLIYYYPQTRKKLFFEPKNWIGSNLLGPTFCIFKKWRFLASTNIFGCNFWVIYSRRQPLKRLLFKCFSFFTIQRTWIVLVRCLFYSCEALSWAELYILRCSWFFCNWKNFYNSKNLICFGALSFLRSVHTFMIFEVKFKLWFWSRETGNGAKKRVVLRREVFHSNFKVSVWTKFRSLASGFLFTCGYFALIFTVSIFWIGIFS